MHAEGYYIVIFDGYCNFCSRSALFIIRRDRKKRFRFAASQDPAGLKIAEKYQFSGKTGESIVLVSDGEVFFRSDAALRIARYLKGGWPLFYGFIILPGWFRDFFYDLIARNRFRLFGKRDSCFLPGPDEAERFIQH